MADYPLNQLPDNPYIRFDDIQKFQNADSSDLILKNVRGDGSLVLANRSAFGRLINWFNTRLLGKIDPNAKYVAEIFAKQVSSLSEHGGEGIVDDLMLKGAPSIRNREIRLVLSKLAGADGNARFRFDNLRPLERRREEMLDCLSKFIPSERESNDPQLALDGGTLFEVALQEADLGRSLSPEEFSSYGSQLKVQFLDYFSVNARSPSTDEGCDMAIQVLRVIALDAPKSPSSTRSIRETSAQSVGNDHDELEELNVELIPQQQVNEDKSKDPDLLRENALKESIKTTQQSLSEPNIFSGDTIVVEKLAAKQLDKVEEGVDSNSANTSAPKKKIVGNSELHQVSGIASKQVSLEQFRKDLDAISDFLQKEGGYSSVKDWLKAAREYRSELDQLLPVLLESKDSDAIDLIKDLVRVKTRLDFKLNLTGPYADANRLIQLIAYRKPTTFIGENEKGAPGFNELIDHHFKHAQYSTSLIEDISEYAQYFRDYGRIAERSTSASPQWLENIRKKEIQSLVNSEDVKYLNAKSVLKENLNNQYDLLLTTQRETRLSKLETDVQALLRSDGVDKIKFIAQGLYEIMDQADQYAEALMITPEQKAIEENFSSKARGLIELMQEKFS